MYETDTPTLPPPTLLKDFPVRQYVQPRNSIIFSWTQLGPEHEINLRGAPYDLVKTTLELMTVVISEGSGEHVCLHNLVRVSLTNKV